ncbi:MAG: signal recognition particle-docking protein FtsY [Candidatus Woesearchaeota archaeon]|nr:MAG: signal recognition particle-docking protein FtsY [Candidatus Woesearchaeota archaeon]
MFKFLKEKLKKTVENISNKFKKEEIKEEVKPKAEIKEIKIEKIQEKKKEIKGEVVEGKIKEKKGFFEVVKEKITTTTIEGDKFEELFYDLELVLLENNVAVEVVEKIKNDLKRYLVDKPIKRGKIEETIEDSLRYSIGNLFIDTINFLEQVKAKKPYVICFVGINGGGKTTTIAKVANYLQNNGLNCVIAAADTFRAASIEQLEEHADKLGVKLIKHDYGADPAAVAFDAIEHAKAKGKDVVLIDTAGRLHSNEDLINEMKKIVRVAKPDMTIFIGESITGNDCVLQAQKFSEAVKLDGIILTKADIDEKGGAAISIGYITKKPILFLGVGQKYNDLKEFNKEEIIKSIGL